MAYKNVIDILKMTLFGCPLVLQLEGNKGRGWTFVALFHLCLVPQSNSILSTKLHPTVCSLSEKIFFSNVEVLNSSIVI